MARIDIYAVGETYKANALRDRNRGGSTVRVFKTTQAMVAARGGDPEEQSFDYLVQDVRARWRCDRDEAIETYIRAVRGDEMEGF